MRTLSNESALTIALVALWSHLRFHSSASHVSRLIFRSASFTRSPFPPHLRFPCPARPVHTFSIVARDPATGELGVAVQSHWFSVGPIVAWAEAGVGAVATQSFVDPSYGKLGLDLMRAGKSAPDTLKSLLAGDEGREVRQVAMIDTAGSCRSVDRQERHSSCGSHRREELFGSSQSDAERQSVAGDVGCF